MNDDDKALYSDVKGEYEYLSNNFMLDIHTTENEIMGVGLSRGETTRAKREGYDIKAIIKSLDFLRDNAKMLKFIIDEEAKKC